MSLKIWTNLFHYLYGDSYFRFTVVTGKEYKFNLGYSPIPFLAAGQMLSIANMDSDIIELFKSKYEEHYIPSRQYDTDIKSQAFLDNSIELFKAVEQKVVSALKYMHYDKQSVQNMLFKVTTSLQRTSGKSYNRDSVRIQIDKLIRSRDFGREIIFYSIPMGSSFFKIYLTKADLAGRDIFTFPQTTLITLDKINFAQINMEAVKNRM